MFALHQPRCDTVVSGSGAAPCNRCLARRFALISHGLLQGTEEYDESIDCWALGCVLAELLTGEPLFPGQTELDMLNRIFFVCGTPTLHEWPGVTSMPWFDSLMPKKPHTRAFDSVFRQ